MSGLWRPTGVQPSGRRQGIALGSPVEGQPQGPLESPTSGTGWGYLCQRLPWCEQDKKPGADGPEVACDSDGKHHSLRFRVETSGKRYSPKADGDMGGLVRMFTVEGRQR